MGPDLYLGFDGACEPRNPGGVATAGWYIDDIDGVEVTSGHQVVAQGPKATNNVAEWCALGLALRWLLDNYDCRGKTLLIRGDSQLVCHQLDRSWNCNKESLQKLRARCWEILEQLGLAEWQTQWVPREHNERADRLSKLAYVEHTGQSAPERRRRK